VISTSREWDTRGSFPDRAGNRLLAVRTGAGQSLTRRKSGLPTGLLLPSDSRVPHTLAVRSAQLDEGQEWQREFVSEHVDLGDERDVTVWFHFCTGHHLEFLYWQATAVAADNAVAAIGADDRPDATRWIGRIASLVRGSAAMLRYCAAFDPTRYDPCLRPSMMAEREDFSGDMSRDFVSMMAVRAELAEVLKGHESDYADALVELKRAQRFWMSQHGEVLRALHPGSSLLREKLLRLERESATFDPEEYMATVVHSDEALRAYDHYFGVRRLDEMKIGDYWTQAVEKLATVHRSFAMDAVTRTALMRGDGTLLAIISDSLAVDRGAPAEA
jgi:hypothetical protein